MKKFNFPKAFRKLYHEATDLNKRAKQAATKGHNPGAMRLGQDAFARMKKAAEFSLNTGLEDQRPGAHRAAAILALNIGKYTEALELIDRGLQTMPPWIEGVPMGQMETELNNLRQAAMRARIQLGEAGE